MPERWILQRGQRDPLVWPFDSRQAAEDFQLDHGLDRWRVERQDDPEKAHEPICASCREPWPCNHQRVEHAARNIVASAANRCHRCGKQCGWMKVQFPGAGELGEDIVFHGKLGACFNAAKRLAAETQNEEALRDIARVEAQRERSRAWNQHCAEVKVAEAKRTLDRAERKAS